MLNTLLAVKKNMTSGYDARGRRVAVTLLEVAPNIVTQVKKVEDKDGYDAVQLGMGTKKSVRKPQIGHVKKAGIEAKIRWLREVRTEETKVNPGEEITVGKVFAKGDEVKVTGVSKGRGFAGGVKRYGFAGGPKTHGQSDRHRAPGSIGSGTTPGRVFKGKRMAGHMGVNQVSVRGLEVISVDKKTNIIGIKGAVPGPAESLVIIEKLGRIKGYTPPPEEKEDEEEETEDGKQMEQKTESVGPESSTQSVTPESSEESVPSEQEVKENA